MDEDDDILAMDSDQLMAAAASAAVVPEEKLSDQDFIARMESSKSPIRRCVCRCSNQHLIRLV
jgi:hypothetical protein